MFVFTWIYHSTLLFLPCYFYARTVSFVFSCLRSTQSQSSTYVVQQATYQLMSGIERDQNHALRITLNRHNIRFVWLSSRDLPFPSAFPFRFVLFDLLAHMVAVIRLNLVLPENVITHSNKPSCQSMANLCIMIIVGLIVLSIVSGNGLRTFTIRSVLSASMSSYVSRLVAPWLVNSWRE